MPLAIDQVRGANAWSEVQVDLFNKLPIYLTKYQIKYNKLYDRWGKLLTPYKWTPNSGSTMRGVRKERSPILRSTAFPNAISSRPLKDVISVREVKEDCQLYRQDFDSELFQFLPSFQDFLTNHVDATNEDMAEKIMVYKDLFYRTAIFHASPAVYLCGNEGNNQEAVGDLVAAPYWSGATISAAKNTNTLSQYISQTSQMLTMEHLHKLSDIMYGDINAEYYESDTLPDGSNGEQLKGKYCLVHGQEVWSALTATGSFLLANKPFDMNIVSERFKGNLWGQWTCMQERFELRIASDGTLPAPETWESNPDAYNYGETVMNPAYVNAPWAVAFACGAEAYKAVQVGPPPNMFAGKSFSLDQFNGMDWNGKIHITRDVSIPTPDQAGTVFLDTNKRGEYLQLISDIVMGIMPVRRRNIVPIIYKRQRIQTS